MRSHRCLFRRDLFDAKEERKMDAFDAIKRRVSCRSFREAKVPAEELEKVVDAGRRAPTANNVQPVEFVVVTDETQLARLAGYTDHGQFIAKAPACIAVFSRATKYYLEDGCAAVENILIAAAAMGLGTCWVAGDKKLYCGQIQALLKAPQDFKLIALVPIGFPADDGQAHEKRPLKDVLHWGGFNA